MNQGYFYFLPQGRYFLLYMYNFCIKGHLLIYGYHFVHLAKMKFKLKLCFQNDLIRFIGDKLDKKSKLILVCMRYHCSTVFPIHLVHFRLSAHVLNFCSYFHHFILICRRWIFLYVFV
jgi:hypothetical protein